MNIQSVAAAGIAAGVALTMFGAALPAMAASNNITSITLGTTTARSGETITISVNGSSDDTVPYTFTGCSVFWMDGVPGTQQNAGLIVAPAGTGPAPENSTANDMTFRWAGWAGEDCNNVDLGSTAAFDSGTLTVTPQVVVDDVTLTVGAPIAGADNFPVTFLADGGLTPFDWSNGGMIVDTAIEDCGDAPGGLLGLPDGVTIDNTFSAYNSAPELMLQGTPVAGSEGDYVVCLSIMDGVSSQANAWMNLSVAAASSTQTTSPVALATSGTNSSVITGTVGGAVVALLLGAFVMLQRRRAQG